MVIEKENKEIEELEALSQTGVKIYDVSIVKEKTYKESKLNRIYNRKSDNKVYISYENRPSRYQTGKY